MALLTATNVGAMEYNYTYSIEFQQATIIQALYSILTPKVLTPEAREIFQDPYNSYANYKGIPGLHFSEPKEKVNTILNPIIDQLSKFGIGAKSLGFEEDFKYFLIESIRDILDEKQPLDDLKPKDLLKDRPNDQELVCLYPPLDFNNFQVRSARKEWQQGENTCFWAALFDYKGGVGRIHNFLNSLSEMIDPQNELSEILDSPGVNLDALKSMGFGPQQIENAQRIQTIRGILETIKDNRKDKTKGPDPRQNLFENINLNTFNDLVSFYLEQPQAKTRLEKCIVIPGDGKKQPTSLWQEIQNDDLVKALKRREQLPASAASLVTELWKDPEAEEDFFAVVVLKKYPGQKEYLPSNSLPQHLWREMRRKAETGDLKKFLFIKHDGDDKNGHYVSVTAKELSVKSKK